MKQRLFRIFLLLGTLVVLPATIFSDEGMWMLNQLDKLPWSKMKQHGLELTPEQIYNPNGPSIKDAIILLGGGTSSFVSADGLILTNHHVAFAAIQSVSSVEEDYLKNGFYAKTKEEELSVPSYTAQIVASIKDVTSEILSAVSDTMSPESRLRAIQAKSREVEKAAKGSTDFECRVAEMYSGVKYILSTYEVLRDVRLVYAPPTSIGNYGGEVDNWYWPRHTGDFSLMRVYAAPDGKPAKYSKQNVPYKPKVFLPLSIAGHDEGSFAMIMGFPGRTFRYRTSTEIELAKEETLPLTMDIFKTRMDIIEAAGKNDRSTEIKYSSRWRGLANTYKNYQGTLEGMQHANIMKQRQDQERLFGEFLHSKPELEQQYGSVMKNIADVYQDLKTFNRKQVVLGQLLSGVDILQVATRFNAFANSFAKDSTSGEMKPPEAGVNELKEYLTASFKNMAIAVDKEVMTALILKAADLPPGQRIARIDKIVGMRVGEGLQKTVREFVEELYKHSKLTTLDDCTEMISKSAEDIKDDDFARFAVEISNENLGLQQKITSFNARIGRARGKLLEAWMAWKGSDLYPDANRTLRLTYGEIRSYNPRDGVHYNFETTLGGVMEKETGVDPFIVQPKLRELWEKKDFGRYVDQKAGDVPVAFLADLDITGGNSGSPVINGKGEIIGLAFDGNWEAVVGDYLYQEPLNRSINVDTRYILFVLDKFSNAQNLLNEMMVRDGTHP
ncbi:MAG TPA: S46 family peptidase [Bacteroidota bacterium]|nr:S46 family peptidase [Bacteroidota bacterium]